MIDLQHLEQYRENNRIEAKKALGGLPHSIWETYSAFANALGGIILLGVEEYKDKSLHPVDLPDPEGLVREFWDRLNDPHTASVNILLNRDVRIETVEGNHMIVITVPRAQRFDRPVFVEGNPRNSYRRSGEGDYRCTEEELRAMYRDASRVTPDMLVLEDMGPEVFCRASLARYRDRLLACHPDHEWASLCDEALLCRLGAVDRGEGGRLHPTAAGLLMFGSERDILRNYPAYCLEYRSSRASGAGEADWIVSSSGDWSGNVFDFFCLVSDRITEHMKKTAAKAGSPRTDNTPICQAIREALANCLINADYYGTGGISILENKRSLRLSNPGSFRVAPHAAKAGGVSDPRNSTLLKLFNLMDVGKHSGSGIPKILSAWKARGWAEPAIRERFDPERTELFLPFTGGGGSSVPGKRPEQPHGKRALIRSTAQKEQIILWLTDHPRAGTAELCELLGVKPARTRSLLRELIAQEIVVAEGGGRARSYRLKA